MIPWPARLAAYLGFLVSAVLLTSLQLLVPSVDGYITSGVTLAVILMLFILLQTNSRRFLGMWELIVGPGTGTTDGNLSASSIDSLLSRFTAILAENGRSWLRVSDLLDEQNLRFGRVERSLIQNEEWKSEGENGLVEPDGGIEEEGEDSE